MIFFFNLCFLCDKSFTRRSTIIGPLAMIVCMFSIITTLSPKSIKHENVLIGRDFTERHVDVRDENINPSSWLLKRGITTEQPTN